jgi:uncharacterized protein with ParB-like and HNH nuclease domain
MDAIKIQEQIESNRKSVSFDSYDIAIRQLCDMVIESMIDIAPEYQRHFVWDETRQSQLIESILLGIPVPSLFMATNKNSTWEVIDGLQRLTTIINFIGTDEIIHKVNPLCKKLKLYGLEKLSSLNSLKYDDLPKSLQLMFMTRPIRVTVLNDRSDFDLRYSLFERLNTGGVTLHPQEIRNCVFLGKFNDFIKGLSEYPPFRNVVKMTANSSRTGSYEEMVLKFFAYYQDRDLFVHGVETFLNDYMKKKTKSFVDEQNLRTLFENTFTCLDANLPEGIVRGNRKNVTPLVLYEAISVGVADALQQVANINGQTLVSLLDNEDLRILTTGATNSKNKLLQRISLVRDALI